MKTKNSILLATVCFIVLAVLTAKYFVAKESHVTILNQSGKPLFKGEIEMCHQHFYFENLKPGESKTFIYRVTGDSNYRVILEFGINRRLERDVGYVTNGMVFNDRVVIRNDEMELLQD